ncbi:MAG: hypothetical protein II920_04675, partial [Clostridia bacterium]|nr:hypothetical protein [Clostridia bacterium]
LRLEFNEETFEMRVTDLSSGKIYNTKVMNGTKGNGLTKNTQKSDCRVTYIVNEFVGTTNSMDSNSMSVAYGNCEYTLIENGIEISFTIGDKTLTSDDLPKMVPVEKYNTMLLPNWSERDDKLFREFYRIYRDTMWVRYNENAMGKVKLSALYEQFYTLTPYTKEDLEEDNAAYGYVIEKVNPSIGIKIRYTLDGSDFLVSVPCSEITFTAGNPVTRIDLLPYFMSADTEQEGYIFVPDGCGSIINLNNGKTTALSYDDKVYGQDELMNVETYVAPYEPIHFPVYGIKAGDSATLAIIENGAELAGIFADISGRSDEFNRVYSYFTLRPIEQVSVVGTASGGSPRYPTDVFTDDIVLRYRFLNGEEASYVGMARSYRNYLLDRGMLTLNEIPEDAPFFAEIIGAVRKTEFAAGVPYESRAVATTISQAGEILTALIETGVKEPILLMRGFYEGGVKHESLSSLNLESDAGKASELTRLTETAEAVGARVYTVTNVIKVYSTDNFSKSSQASRRQDDYIANIINYAEPILARGRSYTDSFYVSPWYLGEYSQKLSRNFSKADFRVSGLALDDIGHLLVGDYRNKENISRVNTTPRVIEAIDTISQVHTLVMSAPNDYALKNASMVYDLPDGNNGHKVEDASVPFIQLVLDGACVYTSKAWNESAYMGIWRELNFAIESKSCPHFIFSYQDEEIFLHTEDTDTQGYFMTQYEQWLGMIGESYAAFNDYWHKVRTAQIISHDIPAYGVRRTVFDNGVTAYVNYNSKPVRVDGIEVPARYFAIVEVGQ